MDYFTILKHFRFFGARFWARQEPLNSFQNKQRFSVRTAFLIVTCLLEYSQKIKIHFGKAGAATPHPLSQNGFLFSGLALRKFSRRYEHLALRRRHITVAGISLPLWVLIFSSFTIVEELGQGFSPNRSVDWLDLVCSLVGVALGYKLAERGKKQATALPNA